MSKDSDNLIDALKEITEVYEEARNRESSINQEISMWRNIFLSSQNLLKHHEEYFLSIPSKLIMKYGVKKIIEDIKKPSGMGNGHESIDKS